MNTPVISDKSRCLFHYTSSEGLLGILQSGSIHASHYGFLNDRSEGNALREILLPYLAAETRKFLPKLIQAKIINAELLAVHGDGYYDAEVSRMFDAMASATDRVAPYFIASFCMHGEGTDHHTDGLLSQWRGYARGGFAIEFDEFAIDELTKRENAACRFQGILTNAVRYRDFDKFVQVERFTGFAATLFKAVLEHVIPKARTKLVEILGSRTTEDFAHPYLSTAPFLKNAGFEEEQEYRVVALCNRIGVSDLTDKRRYKDLYFRTRSDGRIVPYIKLFDLLDDDLPIKSIVVGPHPHQDAQLAAVRLVTEEYGIKCDIRPSRIPFRE
jgi:Protein of unknown function (DUF2971)